ncbi:MAG: bifunctional DNA primase/polymerase [Methylocella sp.]
MSARLAANAPSAPVCSFDDIRDAAEDLTRRGLSVFKLSADSCRPLVPSPWERATSDPSRARAMFTNAAGGQEAANIAVVTGDRFIVVDVDVKGDKQGLASLEIMKARGLDTETLTARSKSGGFHLFFEVPPGYHYKSIQGNSAYLPGIDIKGTHGYVVGVGSSTPQGSYTWEKELPILPCPDFLLKECQKELLIERKAATPYVLGEADTPEIIAKVTNYLLYVAPAGVADVNHHDSLIAAAQGAMDRGATPELAAELIIEHWSTRPDCSNVDPELIRYQIAEHAPRRNDPIGIISAISADDAFEAVTLPKPVAKAARVFKASEFMAQRVPTIPVIEGLISAGGVYTLTGSTGAGKTGLLLNIALAVAFNHPDIIGRDVEAGPVLYMTAENPNKFRERLILAAIVFGISEADLDSGKLQILPGFATETEMLAEVKNIKGGFSLVVLDTLASYFAGSDFNDNAQTLNFLRGVRPITATAGAPAVLIAAHPVKNAAADNLVPYGGGAILNEVDGNLTLSATADKKGSILHWQGKLREPDFEPIHYVVDQESRDQLLDGKGRALVLPIMRFATDKEVKAEAANALNAKQRILVALAAGPQLTAAAIARVAGLPGRSTSRYVNELLTMKLLGNGLAGIELTPKGAKQLAAVLADHDGNVFQRVEGEIFAG